MRLLACYIGKNRDFKGWLKAGMPAKETGKLCQKRTNGQLKPTHAG